MEVHRHCFSAFWYSMLKSLMIGIFFSSMGNWFYIFYFLEFLGALGYSLCQLKDKHTFGITRYLGNNIIKRLGAIWVNWKIKTQGNGKIRNMEKKDLKISKTYILIVIRQEITFKKHFTGWHEKQPLKILKRAHCYKKFKIH